MPLFESLSTLIPSWSPRRPSNPPSVPTLPPPSDDISDPRLRAQSSGDSVEFLGLSPKNEVATGFESCSSDNPSYAESSIPQDPPPVRPRLRQSIPMPFGMSRLPERRRPTDPQSDTRAEGRLFGNYSAGPNAVPIIPGATLNRNKSLQSHSRFKPCDTLSGKSKESGPVRARGKKQLQTYGPSRSRLEKTAEYEPERPAKRRRQDQASASDRRISLDSDDVMEQTASSPDPKQHTTKVKEACKFPGALGEHRYVERNNGVNRPQECPREPTRQRFSSDGDTDERFTEIAASQRKSSIEKDDARLDRDSKPEVIQSVEVQIPKGSARERGGTKSPLLQTQFFASDGSQQNSDMKPSPRRRSSGSPDELQGEATVKPSLSPVVRRGKGDVSSRAERWAGSPVRMSSPSDIQPTNFLPRRPNRSKAKSENEDYKHSLNAVLVRLGSHELLASGGGPLEVRIDNKYVEVAEHSGRPKYIFKVLLKKFTQVIQGEHPSYKVRLRMRKTEFGDHMDIELSTQDEQRRFVSLLGERLAVIERSSQWMDSAFKKGEKSMLRYVNGPKRPSESILEKSPEPRVEAIKRPKLSDSLQDDHGNTNSYLSRAARKSGNSHIGTYSRPIQEIEIPVKTYKPASPTPIRETRSMLRRQHQEPIVCDDDDDDDHEVDSESTPDLPPGKWSRPLVYPRFGRNTAEVHAQDRERLRGSEFLNDNLIGFYIRFLEDHLNRTNKEAAKRVYFFNSFFFTTITNTPRGQRGINYKSVEKWTRNVDLFSYDYIVVPINESAHWYVAIICNLPSLQGAPGTEPQNESKGEKRASRPMSEAREIPETPEASQEPVEAMAPNQDTGPKEETARHSLATMSLSDRTGPGANNSKENPTADEDWPEFEENPTPSPARFSSSADKADTQKGLQGTPVRAASSQKGKKQKKKAGPPPQRYDARQPMVITFDSLDLGRSPTISTLREYLYEEAKSKKGVEIDTKMIRGMRARQIPLQRNFSDCGLYLLAYLEKFVQNPDEFVTKLLRKEMDTDSDWPRLKSGLLRRRLRNFLDELYDEQEQRGSQKDSTKTTLADRQPITFLLGPDPDENRSGEPPSDGPSKEVAEAKESKESVSPEKQTGTKSRDATPKIECDPKQKSKDRKVPKEQNPDRTDNDGRKADREVIEVPDSQDGGETRLTNGHKESQPGEGQKDTLSVGRDGSEQEENSNPEDTGDSIVEVQVTGTPPPESGPKTQEVQKSAKSTKNKT